MLAQAVLMCVLIGQCECGPIYEEGYSPLVYSESQVARRTSQRLVTCYYKNKGTVNRKTYAKARVSLGGPEDLINLPIINGCAPSIAVQRNDSGLIVSVICDYKKQIPYESGTLIYGVGTYSKPLACQPLKDKGKQVTQEVEQLAPVPSQETMLLPQGELAPEGSTPMPEPKATEQEATPEAVKPNPEKEKKIPGMPPGVKVVVEPAKSPVEEPLAPAPSK